MNANCAVYTAKLRTFGYLRRPVACNTTSYILFPFFGWTTPAGRLRRRYTHVLTFKGSRKAKKLFSLCWFLLSFVLWCVLFQNMLSLLSSKVYKALKNKQGIKTSNNKTMWEVWMNNNKALPRLVCGLWPKRPDSWCKYNKAQDLKQTYQYENSLLVAIMTAIKKIYQNPEILKKCLHGQTQNPNESFNSAVWLKVPKLLLIRLRTLKVCMMLF